MTTAPTRTPQSGDAHAHGPRMDLPTQARGFYRAMIALDAAASEGIDHELAELVKIRASQLNHCAFCLDMHATDARAHGVTEQRITLTAAWEEAGAVYTEKERAAFALTEAITVLTDGFVPDAVYDRAAAHFEEAELAQLIALITTINAWNRIAVTTRTAVPVRPAASGS